MIKGSKYDYTTFNTYLLDGWGGVGAPVVGLTLGAPGVGDSDGAFVDGELEGAIVGLIEGDDYQR